MATHAMCWRKVAAPGASKNPLSQRRRAATRPALFLALSLATAVMVAGVIYLVSTSLPYLAASPTTDPAFGAHNQCLLTVLPENRVGFAVSVDGEDVIAYGDSQIARCVGHRSDAGVPLTGKRILFRGVTDAAYDFSGNVWFATGQSDAGGSQLWKWSATGDEPERVGDFAPLSLTGHSQGIAALDASGRLISLSPDGKVLGYAQLPGRPLDGSQLSTDKNGELISLVTGGGLFVYRASDLSAVRAEKPCQVEFLWWLDQPGTALLSCGPDSSVALELNLTTGTQQTAPAKKRTPSTLVPKRGLYIQPCEGLPCTALGP